MNHGINVLLYGCLFITIAGIIILSFASFVSHEINTKLCEELEAKGYVVKQYGQFPEDWDTVWYGCYLIMEDGSEVLAAKYTFPDKKPLRQYKIYE